MTDESKKLREAIRSGEICSSKNRPQWEWAVARIYELERAAETRSRDGEAAPSTVRAGVSGAPLHGMASGRDVPERY